MLVVGGGGCARATPAAWPLRCRPPPPHHPKTKGWLEAGCLPGGGTQCHEAGRPDDREPPITCPLDVNERQGASGVCVSRV